MCKERTLKKLFRNISLLGLSIVLVVTSCLFYVQAADIQNTAEKAGGVQITEEGHTGEMTGSVTSGENAGTESPEGNVDGVYMGKDGVPEETGSGESVDEESDSDSPQLEDGTEDIPEEPGEGEDTEPVETPEEKVVKSKGLITEVKAVSGGVFVQWEKIEGAGGYYLERKLSGDTWKRIKKVPGADSVNYTDIKAVGGNTYSYRVQAYVKGTGDTGKVSASKKIVYMLPVTLSTEVVSSGIKLRWNLTAKAKGYYIYRRVSTKEQWTKVCTIEASGEIAWCDTTAKNGKIYVYAVTAYNGDSESIYSNEKTYARLKSPTVKSLTRNSVKQITVNWKANTAASGYQIRCASNGFYAGAKKATIRDGSISSYSFSMTPRQNNRFSLLLF